MNQYSTYELEERLDCLQRMFVLLAKYRHVFDNEEMIHDLLIAIRDHTLEIKRREETNEGSD